MRYLAGIGIIAILAAIGAGIFFFGGYYNVAATSADPAAVDWALVRVRMASVSRHAEITPSVNLGDPAIVQAGAKAFAERGCWHCHGAPGVQWDKFAEALKPDPPDLGEVSKAREPGQLFWVIKNGIKMTGMPGFGLVGAEDKEVWSIVAFVKALPNVKDSDYKSWTGQ